MGPQDKSWHLYLIKHLALHCHLLWNFKYATWPHEWALALKAATRQRDITASMRG